MVSQILKILAFFPGAESILQIGPRFAGAVGYRAVPTQALQSVRLSAKAIPVVADFGQQTRGKLRSG